MNITATYSTPDLTTPLVFSPKTQNQRAGLALANGNIYICFGSHDDILPYTGWVMAYSESTLAQVAVYATTTVGSEGGIWMAGQAPPIDSAGNLYFSTGNGSSGVTTNNLVQTGQSFIKLSPTLQLLDYFTPGNAATMSAGDMDLGSAGLLLVPNTSDVLGGGKQGVLYLVNTNNMGHFSASNDNVLQEFQAIYGQGTSHIHGAPVYFNSDVNGPTTYVWGENDVLRGFLFNATTGLLNPNPFATSTMTAPATNNDGAMPGGFLSISANGNSNGILWASTPYNGNAAYANVQGVLYAFNADTLAPLWSDKTNDARDEIGLFAKDVPPTVANGKVYVPNFGPLGTNNGSGSLTVYGLLTPPLSVKANNATRVYGAANPTFSGTVTGAQNGDTFTESFATTATTTSAVGAYPIVPSVTGTNLANYIVSIVNGTLTVTASPTTTTLNAPAMAAYGTSVTLTATVASTGGTPGGIATFYSGTTELGTGTLNASGVATLSTTTLPAGTDSLTASYAATGNFAGSTSTASSITINAASQTITFAPIASRAYGSAPFAVTATSSLGSSYPVTITVQSGPAVINGGTVTVTGAGTVVLQAAQAGNTDYSAATATQSFQVTRAPLTVTASNATRAFGAANPTFSGTVTGAVGSDSFSESFTTTATATSNVGGYPIVPAVTGPQLANYTVNPVNGTLTVTGAATTTTLTAPGNSNYGTSVALTATVASTAGTPGGTVTFLSGSAPIGMGTLNGGVATLSTTALPAGSDAITASYAASGNFAASASTATIITVNGTSQTITFPAIASRPYGSAPFAVTATSSLGSGYPVTISVVSGPATISAGMVTVTAVGTVVLQATQAGGGNYDPATATQSFQVTPAATTTTLNAPASASVGASVTLTATVASTAGMPAGSVTFSNGSASLGLGKLNTSGVATLGTTTLPVGTDTVTATYAAAGNFAASTSAPVTLTVAAAPVKPPATYTVAANPTSLTVQQGQTASTTLTITPTGGYSGTIAWSCTNLPTNSSCAFAQNQVPLSGDDQSVNVALKITTTQQAEKHEPQNPLNPALFALAFWWPGGLTGLAILLRKRISQKRQNSWRLLLATGLRLCLRYWAIGSIRLRLERGNERQHWDQHSSVDTDADHFPNNCRGNRNVRNYGFDPDRRPYLNHDAVAEKRPIFLQSARQLSNHRNPH